MKIYLASTFEDRPRMLEARAALAVLGHTVTSRWIGLPPDVKPLDGRYELHAKALEDLEDVDAAQGFILFDDVEGGRGGRYVELGYALAKRKLIFIVGAPRNIFGRLQMVLRIEETWPRLLDWLADHGETFVG
jgi:hypothetical protein